MKSLMKYSVVGNKGQMLNLCPPSSLHLGLKILIDMRITNQVLRAKGLTPYHSNSSWCIPAVCYR